MNNFSFNASGKQHPLYAAVRVVILLCALLCITLLNTHALAATSSAMPNKLPGIVLPIRSATISTATSGIVSKLLIEEGDKAKKNVALVELDDRSDRLTVKRYQQILKKRQYDQSSSQELFRDDIISEGQALEREIELAVAELDLQQAQLNQNLKQVRAPFSGQVSRIHIEQGEWLDQGEPILELIDNSELIVRVVVAPALAQRLKPGDRFQIYSHAGALSPIREASLTFIDPVIDGESGLRRIHLLIADEAPNGAANRSEKALDNPSADRALADASIIAGMRVIVTLLPNLPAS